MVIGIADLENASCRSLKTNRIVTLPIKELLPDHNQSLAREATQGPVDLALMTFCDRHDVMLHDRCPQCNSPVMFHRQELGNRNAVKIDSLTSCTACGFDLKRAAAYQAPVAEIHAWIALKSQAFFIENGWTFAGENTFPYSHLYFDVLRNMVMKLRDKKTPGRFLAFAAEKLGLCLPSITPGRIPFEYLCLRERHCLLQIATWYLLDWPDRFVSIARELKVRYSEFMYGFGSGPFWFDHEARRLESKPLGPSEGEKAAMRALLRSTTDPIKLERFEKIIRKNLGNKHLRHLDPSFVRESRAQPSARKYVRKIVRK